jgi:hypothetical protein
LSFTASSAIPDESLEAELQELKVKCTELEKDAFKKQKEIEFLLR